MVHGFIIVQNVRRGDLPLKSPRIVFAGLGMKVYYQGANRGRSETTGAGKYVLGGVKGWSTN